MKWFVSRCVRLKLRAGQLSMLYNSGDGCCLFQCHLNVENVWNFNFSADINTASLLDKTVKTHDFLTLWHLTCHIVIASNATKNHSSIFTFKLFKPLFHVLCIHKQQTNKFYYHGLLYSWSWTISVSFAGTLLSIWMSRALTSPLVWLMNKTRCVCCSSSLKTGGYLKLIYFIKHLSISLYKLLIYILPYDKSADRAEKALSYVYTACARASQKDIHTSSYLTTDIKGNSRKGNPRENFHVYSNKAVEKNVEIINR